MKNAARNVLFGEAENPLLFSVMLLWIHSNSRHMTEAVLDVQERKVGACDSCCTDGHFLGMF